MKAHFFNVGHGDMSLVEVAGKNILIDCNITEENKAIEDINKLFASKQIDYLILTHLHEDHISGIDLLSENGYSFKTVYESGFRETDEEKKNAEPYKSTVEFLSKNNAIKLEASALKVNSESDFDIYCLNSNNSGDDIHYNSLVVKIVENGKGLLFTGDSNCEVWKDKIINGYDDLLDSDILHASHHGSRTFFWANGCCQDDTDAYEEHIQFIMPEYTIISAPNEDDKRDDWPPHDEAVELYEEYTSSSGSVEITGDKDIIEFDLNSQSCTITNRRSISESAKRKSLKGKWQPKIEIPRVKTNKDSVQLPNRWG